MCDPLSIAGAALTVGSTLLSSYAAKQQSDARNAALATSLDKQDRLQRQAVSALGRTSEQFTPERLKEKINEASVKREEMLKEAATGGGDVNDLVSQGGFSANAPKVVRETAARELGRGLEEGRNFAGNLARLGAFGEAQFDQDVSLGRLGEQLGQIGASSRGEANILPFRLDAANRAGSTARGLADIAGAGGSVLNLAGATGGSIPGLNFGSTGFSILPDFLRSAPPVPAPRPNFLIGN